MSVIIIVITEYFFLQLYARDRHDQQPRPVHIHVLDYVLWHEKEEGTEREREREAGGQAVVVVIVIVTSPPRLPGAYLQMFLCCFLLFVQQYIHDYYRRFAQAAAVPLTPNRPFILSATPQHTYGCLALTWGVEIEGTLMYSSQNRNWLEDWTAIGGCGGESQHFCYLSGVLINIYGEETRDPHR